MSAAPCSMSPFTPTIAPLPYAIGDFGNRPTRSFISISPELRALRKQRRQVLDETACERVLDDGHRDGAGHRLRRREAYFRQDRFLGQADLAHVHPAPP